MLLVDTLSTLVVVVLVTVYIFKTSYLWNLNSALIWKTAVLVETNGLLGILPEEDGALTVQVLLILWFQKQRIRVVS